MSWIAVGSADIEETTACRRAVAGDDPGQDQVFALALRAAIGAR